MHIIVSIIIFVVISVVLVTYVLLPFAVLGIGVMAVGAVGVVVWTVTSTRDEKEETQRKLDAMPPWYRRT